MSFSSMPVSWNGVLGSLPCKKWFRQNVLEGRKESVPGFQVISVTDLKQLAVYLPNEIKKKKNHPRLKLPVRQPQCPLLAFMGSIYRTEMLCMLTETCSKFIQETFTFSCFFFNSKILRIIPLEKFYNLFLFWCFTACISVYHMHA